MERERVVKLLYDLQQALSQTQEEVALHKERVLMEPNVDLSKYIGSDSYHWLSVLNITDDHLKSAIAYIQTIHEHLTEEEQK